MQKRVSCVIRQKNERVMRTYPYPPDIEAEITFVPTEQGGRKSPAISGYRPQFYFGGFDYDAEQEYPDVESVAPGQTARAYLRFFSPDYIAGKISVGDEFQVREGLRVYAHGQITKIMNLAESAERVRKWRQTHK
jgi:translation elongation factor EF-Tu-like GTPase